MDKDKSVLDIDEIIARSGSTKIEHHLTKDELLDGYLTLPAKASPQYKKIFPIGEKVPIVFFDRPLSMRKVDWKRRRLHIGKEIMDKLYRLKASRFEGIQSVFSQFADRG